MFKKILISLIALQLNTAWATQADEDIIDPPGHAALSIITSSLSSLKELKAQKKDNIKNIHKLIRLKLLPNLDMRSATQTTLKKHWNKITPTQKIIFETYIVQSLVRDYAGFLTTSQELNDVTINVLPGIRRKNNKAIVALNLQLGKNVTPTRITLKIIRSDKWRIYDVVFSGVSLMKNYAAQFDSHIRRKGIDSLIAKISKKIK